MLPGYVSGFYTHDDCHVDLNRLACYANARMILQPATGLNTQVLAAALNPIIDVGTSASISEAVRAMSHQPAEFHCLQTKHLHPYARCLTNQCCKPNLGLLEGQAL